MVRKRFKLIARLTGLLAVLALVAWASPAPARALPQMPHRFYGNVAINGGPANPGYRISARIGGIEYAWTATDSQGRYGYPPSVFTVPSDDPETLPREGGRPGDTVSFYVAGVFGASATLAHGEVTDLGLAISLATPSVATAPATSVTTTGAILNGNLTSMGKGDAVATGFDYGTTIEYGKTVSAQPMANPGSFSAGISGLSPGTVYHFRARTAGPVQSPSSGYDMTFTTVGNPAEAALTLPHYTPPTAPAAAEPAAPPPATPPPAPLAEPAPAETLPTTIAPVPVPTGPATAASPSLAPPTAAPPMPSPAATIAPQPPPASKAAGATPAPAPPQAQSRSWGLIVGGILALIVSGATVYFVKVLKRNPAKTAGKGRGSLAAEARRLRKEFDARWKEIVASKPAANGTDEKYLVAKVCFLNQIAHSIDTYSMFIQAKSLRMDEGDAEDYRKLIEWARRMMP